MAAPTDPANLNDAIDLYLSGKTFPEVRAALGVSGSVLSRELATRGIPARGRRVPIDAPSIVADYLAGESEYAIGQRPGLSRMLVRRCLVEAEVPIRHPSEAGLLRARRTPASQRRRQAESAHAARKGRRATLGELEVRARNRERDGRYGSDGEKLLAHLLEERGFYPLPQKAIGKYSVDMAATETIAVEVLGGNWHATRRTHVVRTPHILDAGWHLIMVWNHKGTGPITAGAADYIATFAEEIRWQPTLGSQYRVVSGDGELLAARSADSDEFPLVPPSRRAVRAGT